MPAKILYPQLIHSRGFSGLALMPNLSFLAPAYAGLDPAWRSALSEVWHSAKLAKLDQALSQRHAAGAEIYPQRDQLFHALNLTPPDQVKVVILGQDPYHGSGEAHGLAFSVLPGVKTPPSLRNIFQELHSDLGVPLPAHGTLSHWAQQGVLLLNSVLTVEKDCANSHRKLGWEVLTHAVIDTLARRDTPTVFLLWGSAAQKLGAPAASNPRHCVLNSVHPSPLSAYRGFLGCRHFSQANAFLRAQERGEIDWRLPEFPTPQAGLAF